jgi:hypothetical protein
MWLVFGSPSPYNTHSPKTWAWGMWSLYILVLAYLHFLLLRDDEAEKGGENVVMFEVRVLDRCSREVSCFLRCEPITLRGLWYLMPS